jgi:hypothetical protein
MTDENTEVKLGICEALRVMPDGKFIWHPEADAMIEEGDFTSSPALPHMLRELRKMDMLSKAAQMALEAFESAPFLNSWKVGAAADALRKELGQRTKNV